MSFTNLLVKGLPLSFTNEQVEKMFSVYGELEEISLCHDFTTGLSRGEAFIHYKDQKVTESVLRIFRQGVRVSDSPHSISVERSLGEGHLVIVVGGGLAGCCAAIEAAQSGSFVILFDKNSNIGGNSEKASSGMNACGTPAQKQHNVDDTVDLFFEDTLKAGDNIGDIKLVGHLTQGSSSAWGFLKDTLGCSLDAISQCGGHSLPRTHRTVSKEDKVTNVGWEIMSAFKKHLSSVENIQIIRGAKVLELLIENGKVHGVLVELNGLKVKYTADAIVVTTGGFSCSKEMLEKYAPSVAHLPTTNGKFATGDGIELCLKAGAGLVGMEHVQIHPTGFVDPKNPTDMTKFLAPEALRGCGGILINQEGKRFTNELGRRDSVTNSIFQSCKKMEVTENMDKANVVSYLLMNQNVVNTFNPKAVEFYQSRGFLQKFNSLKELATTLNLNQSALEQTLNDYNLAAKGESKDTFGKTVFPTQIHADEVLFVSLITPSIHYTMGGVAINYRTQVLNKETKMPISGLFAAGEVTGGVHGKNRLAGNSLLECVVFGRLAGREASQAISYPALIKDKFVNLKLGEKIVLSNSTCLFRFLLPSPAQYSGLSLGQYIAIRAPIGEDKKPLLRYYSPVSRPESGEHLDLLIKINTDGPMAKFLSELQPGSEVEFTGPVDGLEMIVGSHKKIGLLSGGTGIAPMIQLIRAHLVHQKKMGLQEEYQLNLVYACKDESEILLRDVLEKHQQKHSNLKIHYCLMNPPAGWTMSTGFVTSDLIQKHIPPPSDETFVVICGPPPFCAAVKKALLSLGYVQGKHFYSFL